MQFTLCKQSALAVLRALRATGSAVAPVPSGAASVRTDLVAPDPSPGSRWTRRRIERADFGLPFSFAERQLDFAVPDAANRVRVSNSAWTVYAKGLPHGSFVRTRCSTDDQALFISSPELLFAELAATLHPLEHLMLGHELCGTFCRDAADPYNGPITYGLKPATSVERIRRFLDGARYIRGLDAARTSVRYLNDNAWSPTESLIAALLRLPMDSLGYDFGELFLNPRVSPDALLPGSATSRVPDIMIAGTPVGLNYDGAVHLNLGAVVDAARELEANPQMAHAQKALSKAVGDVRAKVVDDIRRNRELAANGLAVFPVVKEDLYTRGGIDQIVAHLITVIEQLTSRDMSTQKRILKMKQLSDARWSMVLSLLPGNRERNISVGRFICGHPVVEGPESVHECWVEL